MLPLPFPPIVARIAVGLAGLALLYAAVMWYGHSRERAGFRAGDAKWAEASQRMQAEVIRAQAAADVAAIQRETKDAETIGELKNEAASKGTTEPVGRGVAGVLDKLRADQARRRTN